MARILTLDEIQSTESRVRESVWVIGTPEGVSDLDNDELLETVHTNLGRGIQYRVIIPDCGAVPSASRGQFEGKASYQIRRVPSRLVDLCCPMQIHDAHKRTRCGYYSHVSGSEYFWIEMDSFELRPGKIRAFEYLWDLPDQIAAALRLDDAELAADVSEFEEQISRTVEDERLATILRRDYCNAWAASHAGLWKLSYVCCMGIVETLIDVLLMRSPSVPDDRKNQIRHIADFKTKVRWARESGILTSKDAQLTHTLRSIRNIVHPSVELRDGIVLERDHLTVARGFLKIVLRRAAAT